MDADVAVIGVGTMGSMLMWKLSQKNVSVIGFEQYGLGHDRAAAGGETRIFRTSYKEGSEYVPILQEAYIQWQKLEEETNTNLLKLNGGLTIGKTHSISIKNVVESIDKYNLECDILDYQDAIKRFPQHHLSPDETMILDHKAGYLYSQLSIMAAVSKAKEYGAKVHQFTQVREIQESNDGVKIYTDQD